MFLCSTTSKSFKGHPANSETAAVDAKVFSKHPLTEKLTENKFKNMLAMTSAASMYGNYANTP
ncbi:hypothetical protein KOR42_44600 [Thalassoglobus neptunius]|uniref:Uncharacterized protein n=1 Tax=Thalassoglobus neptunius TaxID=1938619 RepID=A0A5C5W0D2_9PLAN|nr:hypothetical protein KOR42_44600 [Thalassoglobus neptunius]